MKKSITILLVMFALSTYAQTVFLDSIGAQLWANPNPTYPDHYQETVPYNNTHVYVKMYTFGANTGTNVFEVNGVVYKMFQNDELVIYGSWEDTLVLNAGDVINTTVSQNGKMKVDYIFYSPSNISVDELTYNGDIKLYPNPTVDNIKLEFATNVQDIKFNIFDLSGRMLANGIYENSINVSQLPSGTYVLQLSIDGKLRTEKFIKY